MFEGLEDRRLMSVGPAAIPNATVNDTVYDAGSNELHVVFYDTAAKAVKFQTFDNAGGASAVETVDAGGDAGQYLSMAQDSAGNIHVAYYDAMNGDLKYARRDLAGTWSTTTVESKNTVGLYPSIAIDNPGKPAISYYFKNGGDLRVAKLNGTAWNISTLNTTGDVGRYSSLALNPLTNRFGVAYENTTTGNYLFTENAANGTWTTVTADSTTKGGGGFVSLAYLNGNPCFSYYDAFNADLKFAERSSRGKWTNTTVAAKNTQGYYTDLAFTYNTNQPAIVYYNKTADLVSLAFRNTDGTWGFETQATGGGRNLTVTDGPSINGAVPDLFLVYTDSASGQLMVSTH
jgi:hypothetical protein